MTTPMDYYNVRPAHVGSYVWPVIRQTLSNETRKRAFEIGCENGTTANMLSGLGYEVIGIDPSESGVRIASKTFPHLTFKQANVYDDLSTYGTFPLIVSLEVIEHLYEPRSLTRTMFEMLEPNGLGIISTPFHGYWKNLTLAISGRMDNHFSALRDGGHIKFFSINTLTILLAETGFRDITIHRVGRIQPLAKSMVAIVRK